MTVVSNTSPILNLAAIGEVDLLGIGILKLAKQRGVVPAIAPLLAKLEQQAGFWVGGALRERVLREAGED